MSIEKTDKNNVIEIFIINCIEYQNTLAIIVLITGMYIFATVLIVISFLLIIIFLTSGKVFNRNKTS